MSHYVLVHGAWEESGMWDNVTPILRQNGHTATAIDLPGHGANKNTGPEAASQAYREALLKGIEALDTRVILTAHSMNGALISHVAEQIPDRIERLVYVTAFLLKNGGTVYETMERDSASGAFPYIEFSDDGALATLPVPSLRRIGLHDVEDAEIERVLPLMAEWQASEVFFAPVSLSEENFGAVPKTFVRTSSSRTRFGLRHPKSAPMPDFARRPATAFAI